MAGSWQEDTNGNWIISNRNKTAESTRTVKIPAKLTQQIKKRGYVYKGRPDNINHFLQNTLKRIGVPAFRQYVMTSDL